MLKVLITGGEGFIARNLKEQLSNEYKIFAPNRKELDLLNVLDVKNYLKKHYFDFIIHAATYDVASKLSKKNPNLVLENNLRMFFNLEMNRDNYGKLINLGSGAEFGREFWKSKMDEFYVGKNIPNDQFGLSKYIVNNFISFNKSDKLVNLRLFGVFGKYEPYADRFISNVCCRIINNMPILIKKDNLFDYTSINDVVKIIRLFLKNKHTIWLDYNICSGNAYRLSELARKVMVAAGNTNTIIIEDEKNYVIYSGLNKRFLTEFDFTFENIDFSIKELYNWYLNNAHLINKNIL